MTKPPKRTGLPVWAQLLPESGQQMPTLFWVSATQVPTEQPGLCHLLFTLLWKWELCFTLAQLCSPHPPACRGCHSGHRPPPRPCSHQITTGRKTDHNTAGVITTRLIKRSWRYKSLVSNNCSFFRDLLQTPSSNNCCENVTALGSLHHIYSSVLSTYSMTLKH